MCWNVERRIRLFAHDAIGRYAVPDLKTANGRVDRMIENLVHTISLIEIALDDEALTQRRHGLMAKAALQWANRRNLRPPALCRDRLVARDHLFGHLDGLRAEGRSPGVAARRIGTLSKRHATPGKGIARRGDAREPAQKRAPVKAMTVKRPFRHGNLQPVQPCACAARVS